MVLCNMLADEEASAKPSVRVVRIGSGPGAELAVVEKLVACKVTPEIEDGATVPAAESLPRINGGGGKADCVRGGSIGKGTAIGWSRSTISTGATGVGDRSARCGRAKPRGGEWAMGSGATQGRSISGFGGTNRRGASSVT